MKAVSLENAERLNEQLSKDLEKAQHSILQLQQDKKCIQIQMAAANESIAAKDQTLAVNQTEVFY